MGQTRIASKLHYTDQTPSTRALYMQQNTFWYHPDHLGSTNWVTDHQGEGYEHFTYTPYGEVWVEEHLSSRIHRISHRFTGQELDPETGLYAFPARNYDPRTSRWLSTDPALSEYLPVAPISDQAREHNQNLPGLGGVFTPVNLAVYHYTANNPIRYIDPDGRETHVFSLPVGPFRHLFIGVVDDETGEVTTRGLYPVNRGGAVLGTDRRADVETNRDNTDSNEIGAARSFFETGELPRGMRHEGQIEVPDGMTSEEFDKLVLEIADSYADQYETLSEDPEVNQRQYRLRGPNSNTAADDIIEEAGGVMPDVRGALGQNWGEGPDINP